MLSIRLIIRGNLPQYGTKIQRLHTSSLLHDSSDSSSSDSDNDNSKKKLKPKPVKSEEQKLQSRDETTNRLNDLLSQMIKPIKVSKPLSISKAPIREKRPNVEKQSYEEKVLEAAKKAANSLGGDVQKTEAELLKKLLTVEDSKSGENKNEKSSSTPLNLSDLVSGMKIDLSTADQEISLQRKPKTSQIRVVASRFNRIQTERETLNVHKDYYGGATEPGNLFNEKPLNIFDKLEDIKESPDALRLTTWETLEKNEFKITLSHPPENIFQEMIRWTEQGKLWKFPIDNEQGFEDGEHKVHFSEHVFMERHLQDWCPKRGPIRHFMELVCVGLSKNPYMTVKEKKDHIAWYREFFASKQQLLKEIGAIETEITQQTKQIEA